MLPFRQLIEQAPQRNVIYMMYFNRNHYVTINLRLHLSGINYDVQSWLIQTQLFQEHRSKLYLLAINADLKAGKMQRKVVAGCQRWQRSGVRAAVGFSPCLMSGPESRNVKHSTVHFKNIASHANEI